MKAVSTGLMIVAVSFVTLALAACETGQAGVKSDSFRQWTAVAADPQTTTRAAEDVLNELNLKDVESESTGFDGMASGTKADGMTIKVSIAKKGEGSEVSVRMGTLGDTEQGAKIAADIKAKAEAK